MAGGFLGVYRKRIEGDAAESIDAINAVFECIWMRHKT